MRPASIAAIGTAGTAVGAMALLRGSDALLCEQSQEPEVVGTSHCHLPVCARVYGIFRAQQCKHDPSNHTPT
jgi:hypothetical protein